MVNKMKKLKYEQIAAKYRPIENKRKNMLKAFISGGLIGMFGELIIEILCIKTHISRSEAQTYMIIFFIFISSLFTSLGFFDKLVTKYKCGLLIPITGFAHSMTSAALDYKREGLIYGLGSNIFKLSGSVIVYGVLSAWFFGMIRFFIGG